MLILVVQEPTPTTPFRMLSKRTVDTIDGDVEYTRGTSIYCSHGSVFSVDLVWCHSLRNCSLMMMKNDPCKVTIVLWWWAPCSVQGRTGITESVRSRKKSTMAPSVKLVATGVKFVVRRRHTAVSKSAASPPFEERSLLVR
mmetsp:Transcript_21791/g.22109  ORF Transcript_21791/g.22109 Transcript_21791/m.22109 type:complete len:141 (+) Transcript_21791:171-593(+)